MIPVLRKIKDDLETRKYILDNCFNHLADLGKDKNKRIYLDAEGRTPQPQDEAESNREDVEDAAILFQDLGFTSEKGTDPTEKKDSLDDWLDANVSFEG